jgi:hypothetical protein
VLGGNGEQARSEEDDLGSEDGKLSIVTVLGRGATGETDDTDDITTAEKLVLLLERLASSILGLAHDLDLDTLGADIVEVQLVAGGTLGEDTTSDANGNVGLLLALLEALVVLEELAEVGVDLELVRVGIGLLGLAQLVDLLAPNFEVLLE